MEDNATVAVVSDTTASVGTVSYPTSSTWEVDITGLEIGNNALTATATDAAENQANAQITVRHSIPSTATIDKALNNMPADGVGTNLLTITVRDANSQLVCDGTPLDVTTTLGDIPSGPYTTTNGVFTCNLTASSDLGTATINVLYNQNVIGTTQVIMEAGDISRLVFTTPVRSTPVDQPSQYIIVETQDAYGHAINVSSNTTVLLSSDAGSNASFSTDNTNWYTGSLNHIMQSGENYVFFWFKSSTAGQFTLDAFAPGKTWTTGYQQINVYIEDNDAPTTTPSPMCSDVVTPYECYYSSSQSVTLSCEDGSGSGCDTTYYSIDGTNPPTTTYTGSIPITQDTVLRFYSTDSSGNDEAVQTVSYYIDSVDPTVAITAPSDGSTVKPLDAISGTADDNKVNGVASVSVRVKNANDRYLRNDSGTWTFGVAENWIDATGTTSWELTPPNYVWTDNAQYEVTARATDQAGNTATDTINFTYAEQGEASVITCVLSSSTITLGDPLTISGTIRGQTSQNPPNGSVPLEIELVPCGSGGSVRIGLNADSTGFYEYDIACDDITRACFDSGNHWTVRASWAGQVGNLQPATSDDVFLTVNKADSNLTMDVATSAVKFGEPVNISGKFIPQPYCGEVPLEVTVSLVIDPPDDPVYSVNVTPNSVGDFLLQDYTGLDDLGEWTVYANFSGNTAYNSAISETITINVVESAGYAIVIQGRLHTEEGLASHDKTTNFVYNRLLDRGLLPDDIKYFNYDTTMPEVDGTPQHRAIIPTKTLVGEAITDWAKNKMIGTGGKPANLYIIMVDHGFDDRFYIDQGNPPVPSDPILASDMDSWLDTLQTDLAPTDAADQEIILILGFCRSGSFIDDVSGTNRVIVTSAAPGESSYKGPAEGDDIPDGEYFVSQFFKSAVNGKSIRRSFEDAVIQTEIYTDSGAHGTPNAPFFDNSLQHPLLDDDANGLGSNDITDQNGDGALSDELFIGVSLVTTNDPGDAYIEDKTETKFLAVGVDTVNLWAIVNDVVRVGTIWVEIKPPNFTPLDPGGSGQASLNLTPIPTDVYEDGQYKWNNVGGFVDPGTYQVFYYVKDSTTENISPLVVGTVYKAKAVNTQPAEFSLLQPIDETLAVDPAILFDWNDTSDPDGDRVTYTILVSENASFTNPIIKETIPFSTCILSKTNDDLVDGRHYYWKVQAIDAFGEIRESNEVWEFDTFFETNPFPAFIEGFVYNQLTYAPVEGGTVSIEGSVFNIGLGGYYLGVTTPGDNFTVTASVAGYEDMSVLIDFSEGGLVSRNFGLAPQSLDVGGNVDGDEDIDLADAILSMQVMNAMASGAIINLDADVNDDNKIGMAETIYILQILADVRQVQ